MRIVLLCLLCLIVSCSDMAGGSTTVGNGAIAASISRNGEPVSATVRLIPADYKAGIDSPIEISEAVSNYEGIVIFNNLPHGNYTLEVIDTIAKVGAIAKDLVPYTNPDSLVDIPLSSLSSLAFYFSDSLDAGMISILIEGTTIQYESDSFEQYENGIQKVVFDNIPIGEELVGTILLNDTTLLGSDTLVIEENDTTDLSFEDINTDTLKPLWTFPLIVGVTSKMVETYGNIDAVRTVVEEHISKGESVLQQDEFDGLISFPVDSIYVMIGTLYDENQLPPEGFAYRLLYSPEEKSPFGGWVRDSRVLIQDHGEAQSGGIFGDASLVGLRWLLGICRGAYYSIQEEVTADNNPVSNMANTVIPSIMSLKSTNTWLHYNIALINRNSNEFGNQIYEGLFETADTISIRIVNSENKPIEGVKVELFPLIPNPRKVSETALLIDTTASNGIIRINTTPFLSEDNTWNKYYNILIKVDNGGAISYHWIPYSEVSYFYIETGNPHYRKDIKI